MKDGGRSAPLKHVVIETAHSFTENPWYVLPQAVEVEGQAEEDDEIRDSHAGQVQVGGGLHVLESLNDEDGHGVAHHAHNEDKDADDGDRDEGGGGEERALIVVVLVHRMKLQLGSAPGHAKVNAAGDLTTDKFMNMDRV